MRWDTRNRTKKRATSEPYSAFHFSLLNSRRSSFSIGHELGHRVIASWLGYRMKNRKGRKSSLLDDITLSAGLPSSPKNCCCCCGFWSTPSPCTPITKNCWQRSVMDHFYLPPKSLTFPKRCGSRRAEAAGFSKAMRAITATRTVMTKIGRGFHRGTESRPQPQTLRSPYHTHYQRGKIEEMGRNQAHADSGF